MIGMFEEVEFYAPRRGGFEWAEADVEGLDYVEDDRVGFFVVHFGSSMNTLVCEMRRTYMFGWSQYRYAAT